MVDVAEDCRISFIDVNGYSLAGSKWLDNGSKIVSVAYKEEPKRLGLFYCNNRPSNIVVHDWQSPNDKLVFKIENEKSQVSHHSVRVNNAGDKFLYQSNPSFGPHIHSTKLYLYDIKTRNAIQLIDKKTSREEFFIQNLTDCCFTSDDKSFLMITSDHLYQHMCLYSLEREELMRIKFPATGVDLLDFRHDIILASGSDINATPTLFVAAIDPQTASDLVAWHQIEDFLHLDDICYETFGLKTGDSSEPSLIHAILVSPISGHSSKVTNVNQLPTVVIAHGGPHCSFQVTYYPILVFFARLGLRTLLINFRGSTGVDEKYLQELCGKIGQIDVEDCMHILRHLVKEGKLDPSRLIIHGGSHGGFLACHLSCQDEFKFTSAVIKNPVTDLVTMSTSDIPDWVGAEALGHKSFDCTTVAGAEELAIMYERSPFSKISKANVPTLMLLGSNDMRVKKLQGEKWIDMLHARGVETLCKVYPAGHDLNSMDPVADASITAGLWMLHHLPALKKDS